MNRVIALVALAACGSSTEGDHHQYVISAVRFPATAAEAPMFALPLQPGGGRNNRFGGSLAGLVPAAAITTQAIVHGDLSLLLDLQTRAFDTASNSGASLRFGGNPNPTPCTAPDSCGHHLTGTASFDDGFGGIDDVLPGDVVAGTFTSVPGLTSIQLAFGKGRTIDIDLLAARIELSQIDPTRIGQGIIAGAITREFVSNLLLLDMQSGLNDFILDDCTFIDGGCSCAPGSIGAEIRANFGFDPSGTCLLDDSQLRGHPQIQTLLQSDVSVDGVAAVTFGMGITAVGASF
jgi:hypothetical protein